MGLINIKKIVLLILGTLFLVTGIIGIALPLLPTTPFLLLAATCYFNSSEKYYTMLVNSKRLGQYIRNYREKRGVPKSTKITAIIVLWASITSSIVFVAESIYLRLFLLAVAVGVTIHLLKLKTLPVQQEEKEDEAGEREVTT